MINSANQGCCYVRILLPAFQNGYLTNKTSIKSNFDKDQERMRTMMMNADVIVFHRPENKQYLDLVKLLKDTGKKIVVDNDDTFKIEDNHPLATWTSDALRVELENRDMYFDKIAKLADLITTTSKTLEMEYKEINNNVALLPNCIDPMDWDEPLRNEGDIVRIGMVGSVSYAYDYEHIKHIIRKLSDREDVQLVMFGLGDMKHREANPEVTKHFIEEYKFWDSVNIEQIPWCDIDQYPTKLNEAKLDMMLIPRRENYFNKCKSNIKFLEAAMCEVPVIAQSFTHGPYEELVDGETGILIRDNNEWEDAINIMIDNKDIRREIGKKAKKYALNNYNIEDKAHLWDDAYKKLI
jgi:glycosyltransferase involved in cell wall biosynthesis